MSSAHNNLFAPTDRMLRQFSGLWIVFFAGMAVLQEFHHHRHTVAIVLAALAVTLGPLGLVWPRAMKPIFIGWMVLVYPIGWVVSRVILSTIYYLMFTPVAFVFRLAGRDALVLKQQSKAASYWLPKPKAQDSSQYLRQF